MRIMDYMEQIECLNTEYINRQNIINTLGQNLVELIKCWETASMTSQEKLSVSVKKLNELDNAIDCREYGLLKDAISIGDRYLKCLSAISEYKFVVINTDSVNSRNVQNAITKIINAQKNFVAEKEAFYQRNRVIVDSVDILGKVMRKCLEFAINTEKKAIEELKRKTQDILDSVPSIELKVGDPLIYSKELPEEVIVGRQDYAASQQILKEMDITATHFFVRIDLKHQGNVLIKTEYKHKDDDELDAFIIAYILRFIESFPIGTVHVHIFKRDSPTLYSDLLNPFISSNRGEDVRKTVQLSDDYRELLRYKDVICEDISKKLDYTIPDLYSLYEYDKSDCFNLIVLRDGLTDSSGFSRNDTLKTIQFLSDTRNKGHNCGLRFLIVDVDGFSENSYDDENNYIISRIREHCGLTLHYCGEENFKEGTGEEAVEIKVLSVKDNLRRYITERSKMLADAIEKKEKGIVSFDDVFAADVESNLDNILYIPIGMSGGTVFEIPFSCSNKDATAAGGCIGYMALGRTGSGKGSLFHSIVLNGCMKYSPSDLQFWLLDFKCGAERSMYIDAKIPHIKIVSEKNKKEDASYLFQMVLDEMERRFEAFQTQKTQNIADYNKIANLKGLDYFPRILIIIDEVQEIFLQNGYSIDSGVETVVKLITSIVTRMRSSGIHFVMISQNLSVGKTEMLKEAYLGHVTGKICLQLDPDFIRNSGFGDEYTSRRKEIEELNVGEAYVSYGINTISKVKIAFADPQEMAHYHIRIRERYPEYLVSNPLIIGASSRLSILGQRQGVAVTYADFIRTLASDNGVYQAVIGESVYGMYPFSLSFSKVYNSTVFFLGGDKNIASSLCTSTVISLLRQGVKMYLINADVQNELNGNPHPFKFVCDKLNSSNMSVVVHRPNQFVELMQYLYGEYKRRRNIQEGVNEMQAFSPLFLIINDLMEIQSFSDNVYVKFENMKTELDTGVKKDSVYARSDQSIDSEKKSHFSELFSGGNTALNQKKTIQDMMHDLLENGYKYNIHSVIALNKYPEVWRSFYSFLENNYNTVFFNDDVFTSKMPRIGSVMSTAELKGKLIDIKNKDKEETLALCIYRGSLYKIRTILYSISNDEEKNTLVSLMNINT